MNFAQITAAVSDVLSLLLIGRLVSMRLHSAYRVFCLYLGFEVLSQSFVLIERFTSLDRLLDYRITWLIIQGISWLLSIWMVYALLRAILEKLPGILRFSRKVLRYAVPLALLISVLSTGPEYLASGASQLHNPLDFLVRVAIIMSRGVSTICVLVLLATLLFVLWFPVRMPRNLAVFSIGFSLYFTAKSFSFLFYSFWSHENRMLVSNIVAAVFCLCLMYWLLFLNRKGEFATVTMGHSWGREKQTGLIQDLEHLNAVLGRAARQ
jgi:hypothetical protein